MRFEFSNAMLRPVVFYRRRIVHQLKDLYSQTLEVLKSDACQQKQQSTREKGLRDVSHDRNTLICFAGVNEGREEKETQGGDTSVEEEWDLSIAGLQTMLDEAMKHDLPFGIRTQKKLNELVVSASVEDDEHNIHRAIVIRCLIQCAVAMDENQDANRDHHASSPKPALIQVDIDPRSTNNSRGRGYRLYENRCDAV